MRPLLYNCRITKATGENEAVEITFAAADADQMAALLDKAGDVLQRRTNLHNAKVVKQTEQIRAQVAAAADEIRDKQLAELRAAGRLKEDGLDAESPAGPADVRPDS